MAKLVLGSSSCRPLPWFLLALLLLASIQPGPGPVMASDEQFVGPLSEWFQDKLSKKVPEMVANKAWTELGKEPGWEDFSKGGKTGMKTFKNFCRAQRWMVKLNPAGGVTGTGTPDSDTIAIATTWNSLRRGGDLSRIFPTFSYFVTTSQGNSGGFCWFPQPAAAGTTGGARASTNLVPSIHNDGRYYVRMTGIRVGQKVLDVPTTLAYAYLSTTKPFTYLESGMYDNLTAAVIRQMNVLNPGAILFPFTAADDDMLCYAAASLSAPLPRIAVLLANNNVGQTMELGGATATDTVWYQESSSMPICLGIRRASTEQQPVLGSMIQSGRTMIIDLTAVRGQGTLTVTSMATRHLNSKACVLLLLLCCYAVRTALG